MDRVCWEDTDNIVEEVALNNIESNIKENSNKSIEIADTIIQMQNKISQMIITINSQQVQINNLHDTLNVIKDKLSNVLETYRGKTLFTFMDDDMSLDFLTESHDVYETNNIKCSLSVPIDILDIDGYMSLAQAKQLKESNYDLLNHVKGGYTLSPQNAASLVSRCKQFIKDMGLVIEGTITADVMVYPNANIDPDPEAVRQQVAPYIKYGVDVLGGNMKFSEIEPLTLNRMYLCKATGVGTWMEDAVWKSMGYKRVFDENEQSSWVYDENIEKGWCIVFTHSWMHDTNKYEDYVFDRQKLIDMVDFIKSKPIIIVTVTQALLILYGIP